MVCRLCAVLFLNFCCFFFNIYNFFINPCLFFMTQLGSCVFRIMSCPKPGLSCSFFFLDLRKKMKLEICSGQSRWIEDPSVSARP